MPPLDGLGMELQAFLNGYASGTNAINETLVNTTTQSITVQYNIGVTTSQGVAYPHQVLYLLLFFQLQL